MAITPEQFLEIAIETFNRNLDKELVGATPKARAKADVERRRIVAGMREMMERAMAHKCSNGASDTTDNDLHRPDPTR